MTNTQVENGKELNQEENDIEWYRRTNPNRAIYISGVINQDLVDRIQPEILKYRYESNDPITVYINSRGGEVNAANFIHGLLKRPNQKGETCHIITVATGNAMSAAANLLALGDYAIAYPDAQIHYHGSRSPIEYDVTAEYATSIANDLGKTNEQSASSVASRVITRYLYMYLWLRELPQFQQAKDNLPEGICQNFAFINASEKNLFDVCAFSYFLSKQLNAPLDKLASQDAPTQLNDLFFVQKLRNKESPQLTFEAWNEMIDQNNFSIKQAESLKSDISIFQALLERRLSLISKPESGVDQLFDNTGWLALYDEFNYVTECLNGMYADKTKKMLLEHQKVLLSDDEIQKYYEFDDEAKDRYLNDIAKQKLELLWFYVVTNCRLLQKGEYPLSLEDAYWLGLINEIMGKEGFTIKE